MRSSLEALNKQVSDASGPSAALDTMVAHTLAHSTSQEDGENYTSSVDACLRLILSVLPAWHWHVGHGPDGILPYASLSLARHGTEETSQRVEATAPTVPLALLRAAVKAIMLSERRSGKT